MPKLINLIEMYGLQGEIHEDFDRMFEQVIREWRSGQRRQSWRLVPKRLLELTWLTYVKYGRVNEKGLDKIWEIVKENALKIIINSEVRHGLHDYEFFNVEEGEEVPEQFLNRWVEFVRDDSGRTGTTRSDADAMLASGYCRYSDQHNRLFKIVENVYRANTPEEKLIAIDQILNFIHGIGHMADWFVEGGVHSLTDLRDKDVKGIRLPGKLTEEISGQVFMVVDVQPEYEKFIPFIPELIQKLNQENRRIVFLFNGHETLGMVNENDYKMWWLEHGLDEQVVDQAEFYDKGYAFFRYCMDSGGLSDDVIANFVRFMYENDIRDSRDMDRDMWAKYLRQYRRTDRKEAYDLLKHADDCVNVPDLMDYLKRFSNIVLCGGGVSECLKEVEIALMALNKRYEIEHRFTY